jgi:amidase
MPPSLSIPSYDLEEATIADLRQKLDSGELTSRALTEAYLERIEALDRHGPALRAVLETNPDALQIAEALDAERKAGNVRGPLHGVPILLKDNLDTADRMTTTAGSLALEGSVPARDSFVAHRLREAGAVLLGKTNMSEWANFRSFRSSSGWSARGGQCRNPYALDRSPSGSSSGTGAAVAASLAAAGVGTETDGSIVSPASACGLVGVKPTVGLVSRAGIIPISASQDTAGPMARTVADAAILLGAMTGLDPRDPATRKGRGKSHADYSPFLDPAGLHGVRLGVARNRFGTHAGVRRVTEAALEVMKGEGAVLIDPLENPRPDTGESETLFHEFKAGLNAYLSALGPDAPVRTLAGAIAFNEANAAREMPYFGQETFLEAEKRGGLDSKAYIDARKKARKFTRMIAALMDEHRLDALVAPTDNPACLIDLVNGDPRSGGGGIASLAAVAGLPHVTVPAGYVRGLPVGVSFVGRPFAEPALLRIAYAFERATRFRVPPRFLPTAVLSPIGGE